MSFKRDSDDVSLFKHLQKRQVSELFVNNVPEDEARLERNGRLLCLVCSHKPLFDTINMLVIHRQGKKHMYWSEKFELKKQELSDLKQRRVHENHINFGQIDEPTNVPQTRHHSLLKAIPYNTHSKKTGRKSKPYERREMPDLCDDDTAVGVKMCSNFACKTCTNTNNDRKDNSTDTKLSRIRHRESNFANVVATSAVSTKLTTAKEFKKVEPSAKTINDYVKLRRIQHTQEPVFVRPYGSKTFIPRNIKDTVTMSKRPTGTVYFSDSLSGDNGTNSSNLTVSPTCASEQLQSNEKVDSCKHEKHHAQCSPGLVLLKDTIHLSHGIVEISERTSGKHNTDTKNKICTSTMANVCDSIDTRNTEVPSNERSIEKRIYMDKYLKAIQNGWKRDRGGHWVRDPEVEFDSDEEPPQIY